jgi:hypothetical protein
MIELGLHTDNCRTFSGSFETASDAAVKYGLKHSEFAVIHGKYFVNAMNYVPGISLQSNPRALRGYLDEKGLKVSQIDGSFPFMGPEGSGFGVPHVQQSIRFAAEIACPMVDTVDGAFQIEGLSRDEVFRNTKRKNNPRRPIGTIARAPSFQSTASRTMNQPDYGSTVGSKVRRTTASRISSRRAYSTSTRGWC